jgi:type IV secretion system protein VirB10
MNIRISLLMFAGFFVGAGTLPAQQAAGPVHPPVAEGPAALAAQGAPVGAAEPASNTSPEWIVVPSGTRLPLTLENSLTTRNARPGDPVYFQTVFPIAIQNRIVIPVGSYVQGEIVEAQRPGKVKGTGEIRLRLNSMIFANGYTVDFNAIPTNAGTPGNESTDTEGKIHGDTNKAHDAGTVIETTGAGAGIGAIASQSGKGAGIGAGVGAAVGLATVLLTRGPELRLARGTSVDIVLDRPVYIDANRINFTGTVRAFTFSPPPDREPRRGLPPF